MNGHNAFITVPVNYSHSFQQIGFRLATFFGSNYNIKQRLKGNKINEETHIHVPFVEILKRELKHQLSQCMRFPTMWYVRPAKPQISLRIRAV